MHAFLHVCLSVPLFVCLCGMLMLSFVVVVVMFVC